MTSGGFGIVNSSEPPAHSAATSLHARRSMCQS